MAIGKMLARKPISRLAERDIDLLLLEEFHITGEFTIWFCSLASVQDAVFEGAWHGVSDTDGESDIILLVKTGGRRTALMIENKIDAPEQERQDERYRIRGQRLVENGKADDCVTVICAPRKYLDRLPSGSSYQRRVSYESIASWFEAAGERRAAWRGENLRQAIEQQGSGYQKHVNEATTAFQQAYWQHLRDDHPRLQMNRPGDKGPSADWITLKSSTFPKGVNLIHKMTVHVMELSFYKGNLDDLLKAKSDWPKEIEPGQQKEYAVLQIRVPHVDPHQEFLPQRDSVERALKAAYTLLPYGRILEKVV